MTNEELRSLLRERANNRCRRKHPDYYDSLICVGPGSATWGPPCDGCMDEEREEYANKLAKMQGHVLSPEDAERVRAELDG